MEGVVRGGSEIPIRAAPQDVFDALIEPGNFGYWVVSTKYVRGADTSWPAAGSMFHHTVGFGPVHIPDRTQVIDINGPERLVMRAFMGFLGSAIVRLFLEPSDGYTRVVKEEEADAGLVKRVPQPVAERLTRMRNDRALKRLGRLVEGAEEAGELDAPTVLSVSGGLSTAVTTRRVLAGAASTAVALAATVALWRRARRPGGRSLAG